LFFFNEEYKKDRTTFSRRFRVSFSLSITNITTLPQATEGSREKKRD
jgi:hypothetical protein